MATVTVADAFVPEQVAGLERDGFLDRLQGPTFLLGLENSRNGGTHIHSVWRDFRRDYGRHLL